MSFAATVSYFTPYGSHHYKAGQRVYRHTKAGFVLVEIIARAPAITYRPVTGTDHFIAKERVPLFYVRRTRRL